MPCDSPSRCLGREMSPPRSAAYAVRASLAQARWAWVLLLAAALVPAAAEEAIQRVVVQSPRPSGIACNDLVPIKFYSVPGSQHPTPAVILLHALGEPEDAMIRRMARFFVSRGIAAATMPLPYHMQRLPPNDYPLRHYVTSDVSRAVQAYAQAAADVSAVADWLENREGVDRQRIGVVGVSLGAMIAHLAMGMDERLSAGVAILGGGNMQRMYAASILPRILNPFAPRRLSEAQKELVREVDPITYAHRNRPRRVLMIQAARDDFVPPSAAKQLHEALGRPPIVWLDTNHYAPALAEQEILRAAALYLRSVWSSCSTLPRLPSIVAPTVKIGTVISRRGAIWPSVMWQVLPIGMRPDHMSLFHLNIGVHSRSPFVSIGLTLSAYVDVGVSVRPGRYPAEPYVGLHMTL